MSASPLQKLWETSQKSQRLILGLMSGTSLDGIDLALVTFRGAGLETEAHLEHFVTRPYPALLKQKLAEQMQPSHSDVAQICVLHIELGRFYGELIRETLAEWGLAAEALDAIASHGQTLYHQPEAFDWRGQPLQATLQIGDGDQIAAQTGVLTISDFRTKDLAVGGAGAPLVPYADFLLFCRPGQARVLHNLGGMSNLTYLPASANPAEVLAFDTGPANVLINLATTALIDPALDYDPDGQYAALGKVDHDLLRRWLAHPFFRLPPPKSTGREIFGTQYLQNALQSIHERHLSAEDGLATLTALTAHSIVRAYEDFLPPLSGLELYFSGGGVHNQTLMLMLQTLLPECTLKTSAALGLNPDAREALSFALFANQLLAGQTVTLPGVTGGRSPVTLGKLSFPA